MVAWPGYRERDQDMLSWYLGQYRGRETKTSCPGAWAWIQGERPRHVVVVAGPGYIHDPGGRVRIQRERGGAGANREG